MPISCYLSNVLQVVSTSHEEVLLYTCSFVSSNPSTGANAPYRGANNGDRYLAVVAGLYCARARFSGTNRALTILTKLELSTYGKEIHVSDGFVHIEYRNLLRPYIELYPYAEAQWAGSRGMQIRAVAGTQLRLRLIQKKHLVWTSGAGFFYEYEKWEDDELPQLPRRAETHLAKGQLFVTDHIELVTSGYYQGQLSQKFLSPRYAVGVDLKYKLTSHFALWGSYAFFYDQDPPIAISKAFTTLTSGVSITFSSVTR